MSDWNHGLLKGLLVGGLIGIVLGMLFAPKSGKETREDITRRTEELLTKVKKEYGETVEKSKTFYEESIKNLRASGASAKEKALEVKDELSEPDRQNDKEDKSNKNILKKAIDAGIEAYREEKRKQFDNEPIN